MAWTSPKTWAFGEVLTSTDMNVYVRDNTQALFDFVFLPFGGTATGGTIATSGGFTTHTFDASGTFTVSSGEGLVTAFVISGGGGGGDALRTNAGAALNGGGGGGGGIVVSNVYVSAGTYTVTVGAGGANGSSGARGGASLFGNVLIAGASGGTGGVQGGSGGASGEGGGIIRSDVLNETAQSSAAIRVFIGGGGNGTGGGGGSAEPSSTTGGAGRTVVGNTYAAGGNGTQTSGSNAAANTGDGGTGRSAGPLANNEGASGWSGGSGRVIIRYAA
jgi:hypothetical protein